MAKHKNRGQFLYSYVVRDLGECEYDYLSSGNGTMVSSEFLNILPEISATGNMVEKIELSGWYDGNGKIRLDKNIDDYKEFVITGRYGYMRNRRRELIKSCDPCKTVALSREQDEYSVDLNEWDDSDICFYTNLAWGRVIVIEKVRSILEKKETKSTHSQKIEDYVQVGCEAN